MSSLGEKESPSYTVIKESAERLYIFDIYVVGVTGINLAIYILCTLLSAVKTRKYANNEYYRYSIICGIVATIFAILWYVLKIIGNDLLFPTNIADNIETTSLLDSMLMMVFIFEKDAFYFGFAFIYCSLYQKDHGMDRVLIGMMIMIFIASVVDALWSTIADVLTLSDSEIGVTVNRGIFVVSLIDLPATDIRLAMLAMIAVIADFVYVFFLCRRFYRNGTAKGDSNGTKGIILLMITSVAFVTLMVANNFDSDFKWMVNSAPMFADNICLFLMYSRNQHIYNKFCGCCCIGLGTKYRPIATGDEDDDDLEVAVLNSDNP